MDKWTIKESIPREIKKIRKATEEPNKQKSITDFYQAL